MLTRRQLIDMYFNLHVIYLYTNITFSAEDREDEAILYDKMEQSGLIAAVMEVIDKEELALLKKYIYELAEVMTYRNNSFFGELKYLIDYISPKAQELEKKIVERKASVLAKTFAFYFFKVFVTKYSKK